MESEPARDPQSRPACQPAPGAPARDNLDDRLLVKLISLLHREARRFGQGVFRVVDDAIDLTIERVTQRMLQPIAVHPRDWVAFTTEVFRNVVRKGPGRAGLCRGRTVPLADEHSELAAMENHEEAAKPGITLKELFLTPLTAAERAAVEAWWHSGRIRAAASLLGQTPRDVRVRVNRAFEKFRREFG